MDRAKLVQKEVINPLDGEMNEDIILLVGGEVTHLLVKEGEGLHLLGRGEGDTSLQDREAVVKLLQVDTALLTEAMDTQHLEEDIHQDTVLVVDTVLITLLSHLNTLQVVEDLGMVTPQHQNPTHKVSSCPLC